MSENIEIPDVLGLLAKEKDRAENEESLKGGSNTYVYAEPLSLKMKTASENAIVRLVGAFKVITRCDIIADNGKKFYPLIPTSGEGADHILWKAIKLVGEKDWDKKYVDSEGKDQAPYRYKESNPDLFKKVQHNSKEPFFFNGKSIPDRGWYPSTLRLQNVIDRKPTVQYNKDDRKKEHPLGEYDYCKKEKKTKILSKDGFMIGLANNSFHGEFEAMVSKYIPIKENMTISTEDKNFFDNIGYDVAITKGSANYVPYVLNKADDRLADQKPFIVDAPLTAEELEYEMYDVEKLGKHTTNLTIMSRLGKSLKSIFYSLNKGEVFDNWVNDVVNVEKKEQAEKKKQESDAKADTTSTVETPNTEVATPRVEPILQDVDAPAQRRTVAVETANVREVSAEVTLDDRIRGLYPNMLAIDYTHVKDIVNNAIVWKNTDKPYTCSNPEPCDMMSPNEVTSCPKCGTKFV